MGEVQHFKHGYIQTDCGNIQDPKKILKIVWSEYPESISKFLDPSYVLWTDQLFIPRLEMEETTIEKNMKKQTRWNFI